jgi:methionyl-tRNA synthetase
MTNEFKLDEFAGALRSHVSLNATESSLKGRQTSSKQVHASNEVKNFIPMSQQAVSRENHDSKKAATTADDLASTYDRWSLLDDSKIDYGYLAKTGGVAPPQASHSKSSFYLTTAINYTNGPAHMGHAYEAATSDVIVRYQRLLGTHPVYFVTGADEHGQKIAQTAADAGKVPIDICDQYVTGFQVLNQRILIANDDYVRTTSARHKQLAQTLWQRCADAGDIYLDTYSGWYNVREETFVTDMEAQQLDYKDPTSGLPLKQVEEESYFFKMSKYHAQLVAHIESNPEFIQPDAHRNQILARLHTDELRDLSISRTTFSWGIPVPQNFKNNHVMYVWVDALSNYLTGIDYFGHQGTLLKSFWPASVHIIGKDILWFHTVIWPCLLLSAGIPLAHQVFAHGFVNDREGKKMSKSLGNVVDPHDMLDKFDVDTFRWYLCKEAPFGGELSFSEESMRDMHNADLCDTIGNLVHRATNLCQKYCDGVVPDVRPPTNPPINLASVIKTFQARMDKLELQAGATVVIGAFRDVNGFLQEEAPWLKKGDEHTETRRITVRACLEAIYALSHLLLPFLPQSMLKVFQKFNTKAIALVDLDMNCRNLESGCTIEVGGVLFTKSLSDAELKTVENNGTKQKESHVEAQKRKKEEKAKMIAKSHGATQTVGDPNQPEFTKVEIKVGKIVKVWNHEDADKLFCEQIDLGEDTGPREIASGLRGFYTLEEMQDRMVLVVCNLKGQKMLGFMSNGMVLAAKSEDGAIVELVAPPEGAQIGERVFVSEMTGDPFSPVQVRKKKVWENVLKSLRTVEGGILTWEGKPILTSAGPCKAPSLEGVFVS